MNDIATQGGFGSPSRHQYAKDGNVGAQLQRRERLFRSAQDVVSGNAHATDREIGYPEQRMDSSENDVPATEISKPEAFGADTVG